MALNRPCQFQFPKLQNLEDCSANADDPSWANKAWNENNGLVSQRAWVQKQVLLLTSSSLKLRYSVVLAVKWAEGPLCAQTAVRR